MKFPIGELTIDIQRLAISLAAGWLIQLFTIWGLDRVFHRRKLLHADQHVYTLRLPIVAILILAALDISVTGISAVIQRLYIFAGVWLAIEIVKLFKRVTYVRFDYSHADNLLARKMRTQVDFVERTIHTLLIFVGFSLLLMTFEEVRLIGRSLIASAGIAGVVIGFAAQKSLGAFISGFQLAFTQPIRIDDVVVIEGEWGTIEEITLTYVVVKIWDLRRLIVPIHYFTEKPFQNWTRTEARLLAYFCLNFDYCLDVEKVRTRFTEALRESKLWDGKVNVLQVTDATENTIQVRFLMSTRNSQDAWDLRCEIREKMVTFVQKIQPEALPKRRVVEDLSHGPEGSGDGLE